MSSKIRYKDEIFKDRPLAIAIQWHPSANGNHHLPPGMVLWTAEERQVWLAEDIQSWGYVPGPNGEKDTHVYAGNWFCWYEDSPNEISVYGDKYFTKRFKKVVIEEAA